MKTDRAIYISEMTGAAVAIGAVLLIYSACLSVAGWWKTVLLAWLPALVFAYVLAHGVRCAMIALFAANGGHALAGAATNTTGRRPIRISTDDDR